MKKLLFFINTLQAGGAERVLVNLLRSIDKEKFSVTLVTVSGGHYQDALPEDVEYKQLVRGNSRISKQLVRLIYHLPLKLVYSMVVRNKYDAEIAYLEGFPTRVIAAGNTAAKKIAFVHCDVSVTHVLTKYYRSDKACHNEYVGFDKVCFVSEAAKEGFESTVGLLSNASVVRNVIDFEEIRQKAEEPVDTEFDTAGMKILCVGRLAKEKAYDRVIRIAAELEKTYRFQIYILGEGDQRSSLEKLVAEKNVKSVKLLGFKSNPYPYMKKADLLICSSLFEGYSTVVAEALLLGLPVLTTRCAGMEELLKAKEDGVIVENSEAALREGLAKILQDRIGGRSI